MDGVGEGEGVEKAVGKEGEGMGIGGEEVEMKS